MKPQNDKVSLRSSQSRLRNLRKDVEETQAQTRGAQKPAEEFAVQTQSQYFEATESRESITEAVSTTPIARCHDTGG